MLLQKCQPEESLRLYGSPPPFGVGAALRRAPVASPSSVPRAVGQRCGSDMQLTPCEQVYSNANCLGFCYRDDAVCVGNAVLSVCLLCLCRFDESEAASQLCLAHPWLLRATPLVPESSCPTLRPRGPPSVWRQRIRHQMSGGSHSRLRHAQNGSIQRRSFGSKLKKSGGWGGMIPGFSGSGIVKKKKKEKGGFQYHNLSVVPCTAALHTRRCCWVLSKGQGGGGPARDWTFTS